MKHFFIRFTLLFYFAITAFSCGYTQLAPRPDNPPNPAWHPEPFDVIYSCGINELNSVESYIVKDLVMDGSVKAAYDVSYKDKCRIYEVIKHMDLASYPDKFIVGGGYSTNHLWIRCGDIEKTISWNIQGTPSDEKGQRLLALQTVLQDILYNNSVFQLLPPPRGGRS